jgi:hypothetical protein
MMKSDMFLPELKDLVENYKSTGLGKEIDAGESYYIELAKSEGINPITALNNMVVMLDWQWSDPGEFLADLGSGKVEAIVEARSHFGLPPLE